MQKEITAQHSTAQHIYETECIGTINATGSVRSDVDNYFDNRFSFDRGKIVAGANVYENLDWA